MEIEVRAFVNDFDKVKQRLIEINAVKIDETEIEDIWICKNDVKCYEDTKMNKVGSYGLRLRIQKDRPHEITVKTIVSERDHQIFDEIETEFKDINKMKKILEIIGFKIFCVLKKKRETFSYRDMKINLEDIEGFRPCVEIEIIDDNNFEDHKDAIRNVFNLLNIDEKDRIETSITSLFMEENAFK